MDEIHIKIGVQSGSGSKVRKRKMGVGKTPSFSKVLETGKITRPVRRNQASRRRKKHMACTARQPGRSIREKAKRECDRSRELSLSMGRLRSGSAPFDPNRRRCKKTMEEIRQYGKQPKVQEAYRAAVRILDAVERTEDVYKRQPLLCADYARQ